MSYVDKIIEGVKAKDPNQPEFLQAAEEVLDSIRPVVDANKWIEELGILERITEPERIIQFRVPWVDDKGNVQVNRGYRVEFNSALGPYKGGLRFHPSVNLSIIKFLGFEQIFKNSLTTRAIGGGKGGSDFDPKGKSDFEVMKFCQAFMTELQRHIGANTDVPAGDIGVGGREIGFMFGQYKKVKNVFEGVLTGKGLEWGGSVIRNAATGFGLVHMVNAHFEATGDSFKGKTVAISGSGNVAIYAAEKVVELGGKVVTMTDSTGWIYDENGIDLAQIHELKEVKRARLSEYKGGKYQDGKGVWTVKCDVALPCATQNELDKKDAETLIANGCKVVGEGANMPTTADAFPLFIKEGVAFFPGKASNAGGVGISAYEMTQNAQFESEDYFREDGTQGDVLKVMMYKIYNNMASAAEKYGKKGDFVIGANIAGFEKVANAMRAQGIV